MVFVPKDHFLWDFWFAPRAPGEPYHLFYLRAPRSLPDPELRHGQAHIGHAVSDDLISWQELPEAFAPAAEGQWDDRAIWTGSIILHEDRYYWFYTAINRRDRVQRIGLATSDNLDDWERHPDNPLIEADPRWYEKVPAGSEAFEAWRDPWVVPDEERGGWAMFVTASGNTGPADERGVIGAACSDDLIHWVALPPVSAPGAFAEMEVPQSLRIGNRWLLLFCSAKPAAAVQARNPDARAWKGTHHVVADDLLGPYDLPPQPTLVADPFATFYAGRTVESPDGPLVFLAWRQHDGVDRRGTFIGGLSNPASVSIASDGRLMIDATQLWPSD